jgi:uncharacterized membrane protein
MDTEDKRDKRRAWRRRMSWLARYRVRHYFESSIWIFPALGVPVALFAVRFLHRMEQTLGWHSNLDPETARTVLATMASSMFTFVVFVSSALLVSVQLASSQLTPRVIATVFRDPVTRFALTVFIFAFTFTLAALVQIKHFVPLVTSEVAAYSCLASLGVFLYLIDHVGKTLRPSGALRAVAFLGRDVIENVYPRRLAEAACDTPTLVGDTPLGEPRCTVASQDDGVVLAFDIKGLVALAERADCVIEMVPQVGDFVATDDPLFRIFGGRNAVPERALRRSVALGHERTMEQDPAFPFRIMVDIASKGLSPGINDPTTAVLAIDQIHHLLRLVGDRQLADGHERDAKGRLRLLYRTPDWEDFVQLAITEIRQYGGTSIQVNRRVRAMLENLIQTLPESRGARLRQELIILHRSSERFFTEPEDRALADVSDFQGVGGGRRQANDRPAQPDSSAPQSLPPMTR